VIIAGDWNVVQDYRVDTLNYTGENNPKSKLKINQMINNMDLVDVWHKFLIGKKYFVSDIQSFTKIHHFHNIFWSYTYHHLFL
jgi:hypothetical protein